MKETILGELEVATMICDEKHIEDMDKKLEAFHTMEKLLNDNFTHKDFINSMDKIVYRVFNIESKNNFLLPIIYLKEICGQMFKLYSNGNITREQFDNLVLLDNELDKMIPYDKTSLFNRGKYMYIHNYIHNLVNQLTNDKKRIIEGIEQIPYL